MPVPVFSAAHSICELRDWTISNLELQKILYIAHMIHLGKTGGEPLIREKFQAWEYGPVVPELYKRVRGFGSDPVRNVFHWDREVSEDTQEYESLAEASDQTQGMRPGQLVAITHWPRGAWYRTYKPGKRGIVIPNELILDEYRAREAA